MTEEEKEELVNIVKKLKRDFSEMEDAASYGLDEPLSVGKVLEEMDNIGRSVRALEILVSQMR